MSDQRFRGDPYGVLDVSHAASDAQIKRRWRELAREHHPDRAAGDAEAAAQLTRRMARINAAYDLLRDRLRRAAWDASPAGRSSRAAADTAADNLGRRFDDESSGDGRAGPPPPPRTAPVTARFDTSASLRPRNARVGDPVRTLHGQVPRARRSHSQGGRDLRASTPTGPIVRHPGERPERLPTLAEARETMLEFGRFHGYTLGEVELLEPSYIDWVSRTITRDRDLVVRARIIQADLDDRGVGRRAPSATSDYDSGAATG